MITPTAPVPTCIPARLSDLLRFLGIPSAQHTAVEQQLRAQGLLDGDVADLTSPGVQRILEPLMQRKRTAASTSRRSTGNRRGRGTFPASWLVHLEDLAELLPHRDATAVRCQLHQARLTADGLTDLADARLAKALDLSPAEHQALVRRAQAAERQAAAERAQRNISRRAGGIYYGA